LELSFKDFYFLDFRNISALFANLRYCSQLNKLSLNLDGITGISLDSLAKQIIQEFPKLKSLSWVEFNFQNSSIKDQGVELLCLALLKCKSLVHLSLNLNKCEFLTIESIQSLANLLKNLPLKSLNLDLMNWTENSQESEELLFGGLCSFLSGLSLRVDSALALNWKSTYDWPSPSIDNILNFEGEKTPEIKTALSLWNGEDSNLLSMSFSFAGRFLQKFLSHRPLAQFLKILKLEFQDAQDLEYLSNIKAISFLTSLSLKFIDCKALNATVLQEILAWTTCHPFVQTLKLYFKNCQEIDNKAVKLLIKQIKRLDPLIILSLIVIHCSIKDSLLKRLSRLGSKGKLKELEDLTLIFKPKKQEKPTWLGKMLSKKSASRFFSSLRKFKFLKTLNVRINGMKIVTKDLQKLDVSLRKMRHLEKVNLELPFDPKKQDLIMFKAIGGSSLTLKNMFLSMNLLDYYKELQYEPSLSLGLRYFDQEYRVNFHFCHAPDLPIMKHEESSLECIERLLFDKSPSLSFEEYRKKILLFESMTWKGFRMLALDIPFLSGYGFRDLGFLVDDFAGNELHFTIKISLIKSDH